MELKTNKLAHIRYTKSTDIGGRLGEVTDRVIIPTYVPYDSVKALDVSDLSETDACVLQSLMKEYTEYVELKMATIFNFEDFVAQTYGVKSSSPSYDLFKETNLKRRTFKLSNLEVIKAE